MKGDIEMNIVQRIKNIIHPPASKRLLRAIKNVNTDEELTQAFQGFFNTLHSKHFQEHVAVETAEALMDDGISSMVTYDGALWVVFTE
jgi:hypothetical protein